MGPNERRSAVSPRSASSEMKPYITRGVLIDIAGFKQVADATGSL